MQHTQIYIGFAVVLMMIANSSGRPASTTTGKEQKWHFWPTAIDDQIQKQTDANSQTEQAQTSSIKLAAAEIPVLDNIDKTSKATTKVTVQQSSNLVSGSAKTSTVQQTLDLVPGLAKQQTVKTVNNVVKKSSEGELTNTGVTDIQSARLSTSDRLTQLPNKLNLSDQTIVNSPTPTMTGTSYNVDENGRGVSYETLQFIASLVEKYSASATDNIKRQNLQASITNTNSLVDNHKGNLLTVTNPGSDFYAQSENFYKNDENSITMPNQSAGSRSMQRSRNPDSVFPAQQNVVYTNDENSKVTLNQPATSRSMQKSLKPDLALPSQQSTVNTVDVHSTSMSNQATNPRKLIANLFAQRVLANKIRVPKFNNNAWSMGNNANDAVYVEPFKYNAYLMSQSHRKPAVQYAPSNTLSNYRSMTPVNSAGNIRSFAETGLFADVDGIEII